MGYYTRYSLTWNSNADDDIGDAIDAEPDEIGYALTRCGKSGDSCKWYNHETDLKVFSLKFPGILFTLSGEGEESGDIWKKYFRDGKMQVCKAVLDFPPFDARLLK